MLSLMKRAFEPSSSYPDKITYMTSVTYLQSVRADNSLAVVEKIKDLLSSSNTRLQGLQFLELSLQQNPDIYLKGRWNAVLFDILKDSGSTILKEHACKILCMLIPCMAKDHAANALELKKFSTVLFPLLLEKIENDVEWIESACMCVSACLKCFPYKFEQERETLLRIILNQISCSVSSKSFEVFAECFSLIPGCVPITDDVAYRRSWTSQYLTTLNTMHYMLNTFLTFLSEELYTHVSLPNAGLYSFGDEAEECQRNVYPAYMKGVHRFINLTKCLAKMLSTKTRFDVEVPIKSTLEGISRLFQAQDVVQIKPTTEELQIVLSTISQMQIAVLVLLESLVLNFNLVPYSFLISQMMYYALQSSSLPHISCETISPLRHAVWKLLNLWVSVHGAKAANDIVSQHSLILDELLRDISVVKDTSQTVTAPGPKSKKVCNPGKTFVNKNQQAVCKEALGTLENVLYTGSNFISKKSLQEIFSEVIQIAFAISSPVVDPPYPYDDEICRKQLYSVLLAITVISKIDQREPILSVSRIFTNAMRDPSSKVMRFSHKAIAMCKLYLHPKKPPPVFKDLDEKQRRANVESAMVRFPEWSSEDYVQNLPPVENVSSVSENITSRIAQTFHNPNEGEMQSEEYMQVDAHYSEQAAESQCNGEDILEIQNSSQCQDDVDSEDEEEEDEDERSYGEEEMNQEVEMPPEHMYIPSTSKIQVLNPVHITSETEQNIGEQEYEELRPCAKTDGSAIDSSNKNMHLNGVRSIVPDEGMPSASTQNVANENGIYGFEDEDLEEEEGEEDEEEENVSFPGEKKPADFFETPAKKQKLDNEIIKEELLEDEREGSRSPTLIEMKADFCCNEVDEVKS